MSPRICPQPPALSILSPRRPVTDEPLPALTTIPSPLPRAAARPESRSLPVTIFAFGQISAQRRASDCRSSSALQPAKKTPARVISFGSSEKIARKRSWLVRRRFDGDSLPWSRIRSSVASGSTSTHAVFVPPPSTPRMRSPGFTILLWLAPFASVGKSFGVRRSRHGESVRGGRGHVRAL